MGENIIFCESAFFANNERVWVFEVELWIFDASSYYFVS